METDWPELLLLLWIVLPFSGVTLSFVKRMVRTESLGNFRSQQLGSFQGLCINPSCDTCSSPRRGKKEVIGPGELNMSMIILIIPATIY